MSALAYLDAEKARTTQMLAVAMHEAVCGSWEAAGFDVRQGFLLAGEAARQALAKEGWDIFAFPDGGWGLVMRRTRAEEQLEALQKERHVQNLKWAMSLAESDPLYAEVFRPYFQKIVDALASNPAKSRTLRDEQFEHDYRMGTTPDSAQNTDSELATTIEKLRALAGRTNDDAWFVGTTLTLALPQIVAVVEAAEGYKVNNPKTLRTLNAALAALDEALS